MIKGITSLLIFFAISFSVYAQDNCASATILCVNNSITSTTAGATTVGSDPPLACGDLVVNNSVWFRVIAINNGNATITVTGINNTPGLEMEVYTGACGSLTPIGACNSANGPSGSMFVNFATTAGTTYYIMVDGASGNQEAFSINATTSDDALVARPDADFITNPTEGCIPLSVLLDSTTTLHGGTNITFQWRIDGGSYIPASGRDTTIVLNTLDNHTIDLRVCNTECGCKSVSQEVYVKDIVTTIDFSPAINCLNSTVNFSGSAQMIPDTTEDPNVTNWTWNFGDPNSGVNNTATGQSPSHTFVGPGASFTVQLIVDASCGPDTITRLINMNPAPVVTAGPDTSACEGTTVILASSILSGALPIASYNWVGPGTIGCTGCDTTTVDDLPPGGPYLFTLDIVDADGCIADTTINITINSKPTVDPGSPQITCKNQPVNLNATPLSGNPPFTYAWEPASGLNDSTLQNPTATVSVFTSFCLTITDATGCTSDGACVDVDVYPEPVITPTNPTLCATDPNLTDTFVVTGAGGGSTYSWLLSPDYALITGANIDSSSIYVTFPPGVAANYTFISVVTDGVTSCVDTVPLTFTVTSGLNMSVSGPSQICDGATATLVASGAVTYAWTADPPYAFVDSSLASQDVSPAVTTVFTIYGTSGTCMQVITDTLVVNPNPVAIPAAISDFCGCATVSLDGTGSTAGMIYLWSSLGGAAITDSNALVTTSTICSSDVFTLTVTDSVTGCTANDVTAATSLPVPDAAAIVSPVLICPAAPTLITLDGTGSDINVGTTYNWTSIPFVVISNPTDLVTTATVSGATIFYLTVTNASGCDSIASDTVFTYATPVVTAGPDTSSCEGVTVTLIATVLSGTLPIASYNWVGPGTIGCTGCDTTTVDDLPPGGPYLFSLDIVDANGCTDDTTVSITINSKPTVDPGSPQITCKNQPVNLNATPLSGNPPFTYAWEPASGLNDSTLQNPTATVSVFTSFCLTITDATGCTSDGACVDVDVYPAPVITPTIPVLCATNPNLTDTFDVTGAGAGSTHSWSLSPDYVLITGANIDSSSIYVTFPPGVAANYTFISIVTDGVTSCVDTVPITFTVTNGLNMSVIGPSQICDGDTATLVAIGAITYAWTANPIYAFTDSSLASQDVSPTVTTVFTISGTAGTCAQTITDTLVVNPVPVAAPAAIADFCGCATVSLDGTGSTAGMIYLWTSTGGATISNPNALVTTSPLCVSDTFLLTVTDSVTGCNSNDTTFANFLPLPDAAASVSPNLICPGAPVLITLDGTGSDINVGTTYNWTSSPVVGISNPADLVTTATVSGATIFYLTVTNAAGCDSIVSDTVFAYTTPVVTAGPDQSTCEGITINLVATVLSGTLPIASYNWVGPGTIGCSGCDSTTVDDLPPGGPYLFSLDIVDANGCVDDTTISVIVNAKPTVDPGAPQITCKNQPVNLNATPLSGNPPFTYAWEPASGLNDSTLQNPTATVSVFTSFCLTITDFTGCTSDGACVDVDVYPAPVINPTLPILCATDPNLTDTFVVSGAGAGSTYSWVLSPDYVLITGANADSSNIYVTFPLGVPANYTFISIITDGITGCADTIPTTFSVTNGLNMIVTGPSEICNGAIATLVASGAISYAWTANPPYVFADSTLASQNVSPSVTTVFTIYGTAGSCVQPITDTLVVNPNPVATAANIPDFCGCATVSLDGSGSTPGMNYLWTSAGGSSITDSSVLSTTSSICASESYNLTVTDPSTGCFSTDNASATSFLPPVAVASIAPVLVCAGVGNVITLDGTGSDGAVGTTYLWTSSDPSVIIAAPTLLVTTATVSATTIFYLTVTNAAGCDSTVSDTVFTYPPPLFTASSAFLCTADPLQQSTLSITGEGAGSTYSWDIIPGCAVPNTASTASQLFDFTACGVGIYNFAASVTDGVTGCVDTVTQTVTVVAGVALTISNDTSICEGSSVTISAGGANTYLWNTLDTTSSITLSGLTIAGSPYTFRVTGTVGSCSAIDSVMVTVNPVPGTPVIAGTDTVCENDAGIIYSVTPATGNYTWTVTGGSVTSGQGTDSITVDWTMPGTGTVEVVDTNAFGCGGTLQTMSVTVNPVPITTPISGPDTVCENSLTFYFVVPNAGSTYSWIVTGGTIVGSSTASFVDVNWSPAGSGSISVLETNAVGCSGTLQTLNVEINPQPSPVVITGNNLLCEGDTMQSYYTTPNAGSTYSWGIVRGAIISGQGTDSIVVNWGVFGAGSVTATEINSLGCSSNPTTLNVTLNEQPVAIASPDSADVCQGNAFPITGNVNAGIIRWTTTGAGTFSDTTIASPVYTPGVADSGYYVLTMVVTNPPCQDDTAIVIINVNVNPVVTVSVTDDTVCSGTADTLTATGGGSYLWSTSGDTTAVSIVTPLVTAYYAVTVTNGFGCSVSDSILITADSIPTTSPIAGPDSVCAYDSSVVYSVTPPLGNYTWTISGGTIASGFGTDSIVVNWDSAGVAGVITVIDTNAAGCAGPLQTINVTISPLPVTPPISGIDTLCENTTTSYFVAPAAGSSYNWTAAGGIVQGSSTDTVVSITWGATGMGVVTVNETNTLGCAGIAQNMNVVINPVPVPVSILGNDTLCENDSLQVYSTTETIGSAYNWIVLGGTILSGQTTDSIQVNWGASANGTIEVRETNAFGCISDSSTYNVILNPQPVASGYPDSVTVCQTDSLTISGSVNLGSILWTTSGNGTFSDSSSASPVYYSGLTDTGYVALTMVVSNPPCQDDSVVVVVFISAIPSAAITATQNNVCDGDSTILSVRSGFSYLWTPGGDTTSSITVIPVITDTYLVTVTNGFGCSATDSILITLVPHGIPAASGDSIICFGDSAHLAGSFLNAGGLQWSTLGDGMFFPDSISLLVTYAPGPGDSIAGGMDIVLATTGACYNETDTMHISISQFPTVFAGNDLNITTGSNTEPIYLNGTASNVAGATWTTTGTGSFAPDDSALNATYLASTLDYESDTIRLILTTYGGCRVVTDFLVIDFTTFTVPNVITPYPASPGVNDYFRIYNLAPNSQLKIWDRWGTLVYMSDYYLNDWDAAELKADTYYYLLLSEGKEYHGWIKVIREN